MNERSVRPDGGTISRLRKNKGLVQSQLADKAGISWKTVWNLEKGQRALPKNVKAVAEALEVDYSALLVREEPTEEQATQGIIPQLVRWGPVDGLPAGLTIYGDMTEFLPWSRVKSEIVNKLLFQANTPSIHAGMTVELGEHWGKKDWLVNVLDHEGQLVGRVWFGVNPSANWLFDGLVRMGVPGSSPIIWNVFQRYSDSTYRRVG